MAEPEQSTSKGTDAWITWGVRLGVVISIIGIVGAIAKVALYAQEQQEKTQRQLEAARLYLDATPSTKECAEAASMKRATGCYLLLKPANPEIRPLRTLIDYPAAASPCGCAGSVLLGGPVAVTLDQVKPYLVRRTYDFTKTAGSAEPLQVNVPVVITTEYSHKGVTNVDISAYMLGYRILREKGTSSVVPTGLIYCGRLPRIPTFVIDPWIPTDVGRKDQQTSSVLVECLQKATWFDTPRGRFRVTTDIAADAIKRGGFDADAVPAFSKSHKIDVLEGNAPSVTSSLITG